MSNNAHTHCWRLYGSSGEWFSGMIKAICVQLRDVEQ